MFINQHLAGLILIFVTIPCEVRGCAPLELAITETWVSTVFEEGLSFGEKIKLVSGRGSLISSMAKGECEQTSTEEDPYFQIRLDNEYYVTSVQLSTPSECTACGPLDDLLIEVGTADIDNSTVIWDSTKRTCTMVEDVIPFSTDTIIQCDTSVYGDSVRFTKLTGGNEEGLMLCSLVAYGYLECIVTSSSSMLSTIVPLTSSSALPTSSSEIILTSSSISSTAIESSIPSSSIWSTLSETSTILLSSSTVTLVLTTTNSVYSSMTPDVTSSSPELSSILSSITSSSTPELSSTVSSSLPSSTTEVFTSFSSFSSTNEASSSMSSVFPSSTPEMTSSFLMTSSSLSSFSSEMLTTNSLSSSFSSPPIGTSSSSPSSSPTSSLAVSSSSTVTPSYTSSSVSSIPAIASWISSRFSSLSSLSSSLSSIEVSSTYSPTPNLQSSPIISSTSSPMFLSSSSIAPSSSSLEMFVFSTSIVPVWCPCTCEQFQLIAELTSNNKTTEEVAAEVEELLIEMTVDKKNTASSKGKLASAVDDRSSAKLVGMVGASFFAAVFALIVISDLPLLVRTFIRIYKTIKARVTMFRAQQVAPSNVRRDPVVRFT